MSDHWAKIETKLFFFANTFAQIEKKDFYYIFSIS